MDAIECLKTRRSVRSYRKDISIDRSVVEDIVDCGRLAATAINIQPWQFVAVTDQDMLAKIASITDHGKFIADAPCCIAVFCEKVKYYLEDGSAATENILLAAHAHGLGSCWVAGDKKPYCGEISRLLGVPDKYTLVSLIAIGHPESIPSPPKKSLSETLHWERFTGR
ncbi:MAG: nitroreductase family protein [Armatimonadetes bacterium]|nr:nitroreductase family protein [Armatimonadota bacterium]